VYPASPHPRKYQSHLDELTIAVLSPFHRRNWMITPRQYRLLVRVFRARRFTVRELAAELGYSRAGLADALRSLHRGGLIDLRTVRGRLGSTWARARAGIALRRNVRQRTGVDRWFSEPVRAMADIYRPSTTEAPPEPGDLPAAATMAA
jgi:hypothetical protein